MKKLPQHHIGQISSRWIKEPKNKKTPWIEQLSWGPSANPDFPNALGLRNDKGHKETEDTLIARTKGVILPINALLLVGFEKTVKLDTVLSKELGRLLQSWDSCTCQCIPAWQSGRMEGLTLCNVTPWGTWGWWAQQWKSKRNLIFGKELVNILDFWGLWVEVMANTHNYFKMSEFLLCL